MQNYYADLLGYVLRDEKWSHHLREAAEALVGLAKARKARTTTMTAPEIIHRVCEIDQQRYRHSPGYLLHLLLAPAARPGGIVANAVTGMYKRVFVRWNAACRAVFREFDLTLRPGVTLEKLARALVVVADGVALQATSTSGQLDPSGESDVSLLAEVVMMLLVGAVDVDKTGVSLSEAAQAMIESDKDTMSTNDVVAWRDTDVPGQRFGRVGSVDLFIIAQESPGTFKLGSLDPFGIDSNTVVFVPDPFSSIEEAQQVAKERIARVLRALGLVPHRAA